MATTQPIRSKKEVRKLAAYYLDLGQHRNHVLIVLGVHTALRVSDLLRMCWDDVYDFDNDRVLTTIELVENKTGKSKTIALNEAAIRALSLYAAESAARGRFLMENPNTGNAISRIQAYRIIRGASEALKLENRASCHSLRKTFGYHSWKNGVSPVIIMDIYNHSSLAVTQRYLGVTQDDKNAAYLSLSFDEESDYSHDMYTNTPHRALQDLF